MLNSGMFIPDLQKTTGIMYACPFCTEPTFPLTHKKGMIYFCSKCKNEFERQETWFSEPTQWKRR